MAAPFPDDPGPAPGRWGAYRQEFRRLAAFGDARAMDAVTAIAAPLLAAGAIALIGVIVQAADKFAQPNLALFLLTAAAVALVIAVQCGFWARRGMLSPSEVADWLPSTGAAPRDQLREEAVEWAAGRYRRWAGPARLTYAIGILLLWSGVAVALLPPGESDERWFAVGVAALAAFAEVVWLVLAFILRKRGRAQYL